MSFVAGLSLGVLIGAALLWLLLYHKLIALAIKQDVYPLPVTPEEEWDVVDPNAVHAEWEGQQAKDTRTTKLQAEYDAMIERAVSGARTIRGSGRPVEDPLEAIMREEG